MSSYPPYYGNSFYAMQDLQNMRDRIDQQMRQIQQPMQNQQPPAINQTFQLAPNQTGNDIEGRFANNIDEVKNTLVIKTGIFTNKDFSTIWIKDVTGTIRTFTTNEVIEMDEKDKQILALQKELENMKGMIINAKSDISNDVNPITVKKSTRVSNNKQDDE